MSAAGTSTNAKSVGLAYALWAFFGAVGAHKFYLGRPGMGALYAAGWASFWLLFLSGGGFLVAAIPLGLVWIGLLIDMFTIPRQVRAAAGGSVATAGGNSRRSLFAAPEDKPIDAGQADAMIARYLEGQNRAAPQAPRAPGGRPAFGRR